jgi:FixJ family two-component response regulator
MENMSGMELLAHLCAQSPDTRVIFITAHPDHAAEVTVMQAGAFAFFIKPFDTKQFLKAVRDAFACIPRRNHHAPIKSVCEAQSLSLD